MNYLSLLPRIGMDGFSQGKAKYDAFQDFFTTLLWKSQQLQ